MAWKSGLPSVVLLALAACHGGDSRRFNYVKVEEAQRPNVQTARAAFVACGVAADDLTPVEIEPDYPGFAVRSGVDMPDARLECLAQASARSFYGLTLDPALQRRFDAALERASHAARIEWGRRWLKANGMDSQISLFDPARETPQQAIDRIEKACQFSSGTLRSLGDNVIGGVDGAAGGEAFRDDRFPCLYYSAFASGMLLGRAE